MVINVYNMIEGHRYLSRGDCSGRHDCNILDNIIYQFSEERFIAMFGMHRASFWQLVNVLKNAGEVGYWDGREQVAKAAGGRYTVSTNCSYLIRFRCSWRRKRTKWD